MTGTRVIVLTRMIRDSHDWASRHARQNARFREYFATCVRTPKVDKELLAENEALFHWYMPGDEYRRMVNAENEKLAQLEREELEKRRQFISDESAAKIAASVALRKETQKREAKIARARAEVAKLETKRAQQRERNRVPAIFGDHYGIEHLWTPEMQAREFGLI